jgi:F-type H+-transporting ATPase subunit epsilon
MVATLPTKIRLEIVTPDRLLLSEEVDEVSIPGSEGYLGILPGHLPLLTMLGIGILSYRRGTEKQAFAVSGGFAEVLPDRVIVVADTVERPEEIDASRARESKERAESKLASAKDSGEVDQAMESILRATARLQVAQMR